MNKLNILSKLAIASISFGLGIAGTSHSALAGTLFDINQQTTGFVNQLSGVSEFGLSDGRPGSGLPCPSCDSVVNFATYANPTMSDWTSALGVTPIGVGQPSPGMTSGIDTNAKWVFFYQIRNTNPLGDPNANLENFNVTKEDQNGLPINVQPYNTAGYIDGWDIVPFNNCGALAAPGQCLDTPNNWQPAIIENKTIANGNGGEEAETAFGTSLSGPSPISSVTVRANTPYTGALFEFGPLLDDEIEPNEFTDVLVLTSNDQFAGIVWAETESPGGTGSAGDVAGIKNPVNVPEPGTIIGLLAVSGLGFGLKRKKQS